MTAAPPPRLPAPIVTATIIALNVAVFAIGLVAGVDPMAPSLDALIDAGANVGGLTLGGEPWRLVTAMFLHGGVLHLLMNMIALWSGGVLAETLYGRPRFTALYLVAGLAGGVATVSHTAVASVGASGAIFGVFGAIGAWALAHRERIDPVALRALARNLAVFIGLNVVIGASVPGIDLAAHVGGLIGGFVFGLALEWRRPPVRSWKRFALATVLALGAIAAALPVLDRPPPPLRPPPVAHIELYSEFDHVEPFTIDAFNRMIVASKEGRLDDAALADQLERGIIPVWQALRDRLRALPVPAEAWRPRHEALIAYVEARLADWSALVELARGHEVDVEQVKVLRRRADEALKQLERASRPGR